MAIQSTSIKVPDLQCPPDNSWERFLWNIYGHELNVLLHLGVLDEPLDDGDDAREAVVLDVLPRRRRHHRRSLDRVHAARPALGGASICDVRIGGGHGKAEVVR